MITEIIAISFGLYCIVSYVLRIHPNFIHKDPAKVELNGLSNPEGQLTTPICFHISHRGGAGENLENTMAAFEHAANIGTEMFELDVLLTKDGHVVVAHDNNLSRLCGVNINISDSDYQDLPPLLTMLSLNFDCKHQLTSTDKDRKIILLDDLFKKFPKMPMNIDIKINNEELILKVAGLIKKYNRDRITVLGNSAHSTSLAIRKRNPTVSTLYSLNEVLKTLVFYYTGLLPFVPVYANHFEIPMCSLFLEHKESFHNITNSKAKQFLIRLLDSALTNKKLIHHLKKRGVPTYFFVLNKEHEWRRAIEFGASGIMTDFPKRLKIWMISNSINVS